ncbi:hypothetical protein D3C80_796150 [compost metagenome]|jgi:hypothetical protein
MERVCADDNGPLGGASLLKMTAISLPSLTGANARLQEKTSASLKYAAAWSFADS